jgi:catechol 2,3-dioxygenase-like lactoylglutathione lyase family enzyme
MDYRHSCVVVSDLDKALDFYCNLLGMKVFKQLEIDGLYPETLLGVPNVQLTYVKLDFEDPQTCEHPPRFELHYYHNPITKPRLSKSHVAFTVEDLQKEYNRLISKGVGFISEPLKAPDSDATVCFCVDPDGNLIELVEE